MKIKTTLLITLTGTLLFHTYLSGQLAKQNFESIVQDGDIIFQTSKSTQSKAIQLATHSIYSHCGIIYKNNNRFYVYEAVQPVKLTPFEDWIARGSNAHFVIKRLSNAGNVLNAATLTNMKKVGNAFTGKNYDPYFGWGDDRIYCSELIWKIYYRGANIKLGNLQQLKELDLSNPAVKQKMAERYKTNIPLNDTIITPVAIFNSPLLITIIKR